MNTILRELAREYYSLTEIFDKGVCTGPVGVDGAMPNGSRELAVVNAHAAGLLRDIRRRAEAEGYSYEQLREAMRAFVSVASALCIIDTPCGQGIGETRDRLPRNYNTASGPDEGDHDLGDGPDDHERPLSNDDLPPAFGGCTCVCHRSRGVMHCVPCCYPEAKPDLLAITKTFLRERGE